MRDESIEAARNRAYELIAPIDDALEAGEIDEAEWYRRVAAVITPAYLAEEDPRAQSGFSGDEAQWRHARGLIADAIGRDGTFLDVGYASGYLMECIQRWARESGRLIEPYGLDIAPELAELARSRLPHWADRIYAGNAIDWEPPMRFDFVRTGLKYVPKRRQRDLVERLLEHVVSPGGRLIVGSTKKTVPGIPDDPSWEELLMGWGFPIDGKSERPHATDRRFLYRVIWIDRPH